MASKLLHGPAAERASASVARVTENPNGDPVAEEPFGLLCSVPSLSAVQVVAL